jgi:hypothetical protein
MKANVKSGLSLLVGLLSAVVIGTAAGCPGDAGTGEGEGENDDDDDTGEGEGDTGEGEGDAGEGEGEPPPPPPPGTCVSDDDCTPTQACRSLFAPGANSPPSACFNVCATVNDACTTAVNSAGTCQALAANDNVCIAGDSANLGLCGNGANGGCSMEAPACASGPGQVVGVCIIPCDDGDVCQNGLVCSKSPIQLEGMVGVCGPQSAVGDVCGPTPTGLAVCSVGQVCNTPQGAMTGTCAAM